MINNTIINDIKIMRTKKEADIIIGIVVLLLMRIKDFSMIIMYPKKTFGG